MNQISKCRPASRHNRLTIALGLSLVAFSLPSLAADPVFSIADALKFDPGQTPGGYVMNTYHFGLTSLAPSYSATLTDTGLFGADPIGMALLSPSMKLMGTQIGSGSFGFNASELGTYTLVVAGKPLAPAYFDAYTAQVTAVPEAGRTAMLLTGLGLVGLRLRRPARQQRTMPV